MCEGEGCKSKEEIREWLAGKYIVMLYNAIKFNPGGFHQDSNIE